MGFCRLNRSLPGRQAEVGRHEEGVRFRHQDGSGYTVVKLHGPVPGGDSVLVKYQVNLQRGEWMGNTLDREAS